MAFFHHRSLVGPVRIVAGRQRAGADAARVAPRAAAPAAAPASARRCVVSHSCGLRALALASKRPCAPGSPGGGDCRLSSRWDGTIGVSVCWACDVRARQVAVHEARGELLAEDRVDGRQPHPQLAPGVLGGPRDRARGDLGLVDRRHGLRVAVQVGADPAELRRVEAGQLDEGDAHLRAVVEQLDAQRVQEALERVLGAAVARLQRDPAARQRRADLHDHAAVARAHAPQRGLRAVDAAEVGDLGDAAELLGPRVDDRGELGRHRVVDPHVDGAELGLDPRGGALDLLGVGHVGGRDARAHAVLLHLAPGGLEALGPARDEPDVGAAAGHLARRRAPDPRRGAGDGHDLALERHAPALYPERRQSARERRKRGPGGPRSHSVLPVCWT